jgi:two-component sensor histidine kinase
MDLEDNFFFDMDTAIPLGMIINELISNSFKHAFPGRDKGEIQIKFRREKIGECINHREESKIENYNSNSFILIVSDDGVGVPENLGIGDIERLGFQLVTSLMDQLELDGELELKRKYGTEFTMSFPVKEKRNRQLSLTAMPITFDFIHQVCTIRRVQNNYQNFWYNLTILSLKI